MTTKQYNYWTIEELDLLKSCSDTMDYKEVSLLIPNHSIHSLKRKFWQVRDFSKPPSRKSTLEVLLENTPEVFYWIGFLLADGNFEERKLSVTYHLKDREHLQKFRDLTKSNNSIYQPSSDNLCERFHITNVKVVKALREKFDIRNNKTKYPPNMLNYNFDDDLIFSMIIGYIDGDGSISKRNNCHSFTLNIVGDQNCNDNFIFMFNFLHRYLNKQCNSAIPKIISTYTTLPQDIIKTKKLYYSTNLYINRKEILQSMLDKAKELQLPYMQRKFGKLE